MDGFIRGYQGRMSLHTEKNPYLLYRRNARGGAAAKQISEDLLHTVRQILAEMHSQLLRPHVHEDVK